MSDTTNIETNPYLEDVDYGFDVLDTLLRHGYSMGMFDREERDQMQRFLNTVGAVYGAAARRTDSQERVDAILADLSTVPDGEAGDERELALLRDLADAVRGTPDTTHRA